MGHSESPGRICASRRVTERCSLPIMGRRSAAIPTYEVSRRKFDTCTPYSVHKRLSKLFLPTLACIGYHLRAWLSRSTCLFEPRRSWRIFFGRDMMGSSHQDLWRLDPWRLQKEQNSDNTVKGDYYNIWVSVRVCACTYMTYPHSALGLPRRASSTPPYRCRTSRTTNRYLFVSFCYKLVRVSIIRGRAI